MCLGSAEKGVVRVSALAAQESSQVVEPEGGAGVEFQAELSSQVVEPEVGYAVEWLV